MIKKFGKFLLAKDVNAMLVAFLAALLPVFNLPTGLLAVLVVGFVTLQKGFKSGFVILSWVALPSIALLVTRQFGLFDLVLVRSVVVWILASLLRCYGSWGLLLELAALVGACVIMALHWWNPHLEQWWVTHLTGYMQKVIAESKIKEATAVSTDFVKQLAPVATGVVAFFVSLVAFMELAVARWWQTSLVEPGRFSAEALNIRISRFSSLFALLFFVLAMKKVPFAIDAFAITLLPLFLVGLSFLHYMVRRNAKLVYLLILVYVAFIFVPVLVVSSMALIAFVDTWVDFRKRLEVDV